MFEKEKINNYFQYSNTPTLQCLFLLNLYKSKISALQIFQFIFRIIHLFINMNRSRTLRIMRPHLKAIRFSISTLNLFSSMDEIAYKLHVLQKYKSPIFLSRRLVILSVQSDISYSQQ